MAERYATRPSQLLGYPPSGDDWHSYCLDEAIFVLTAGHTRRDQQWEDKFKDDAGGGTDLFQKAFSDPRTGRPPSARDLAMLPTR